MSDYTEIIRQGRELQYGFKEQPTFGTAIADNVAFIKVPVEHFDIDRDIRIEEINTADGTRKEISVICRIDTAVEMDYWRSGGILTYVLRKLRD